MATEHRDVRLVHHQPQGSFGISPLGFAIQTLRLNCLDCHDALGTLGIYPKYAEDWCRHLCHSAKGKIALIQHVPEASVLAELWDATAWQAFGGKAAQWRPYFTACPECLKGGYHSMLFQMPWVNQCPWHGVRIVDRCPCCRLPLWKGFQSGAPPLICACGYDHVDRKQLVSDAANQFRQRQAHLARYLSWARASRDCRDLFGCEDAPDLIEACAQLFVPRGARWHKELHPRTTPLVRRSILGNPSGARHAEFPVGFSRLASSIAECGEFFLELPCELSRPMARVTSSITSLFPSDDFSLRERSVLGVQDISRPKRTSSRTSVLLLPAYCVQGRMFFDGRVLPRSVQATLREIAGTAMRRGEDLAKLAAYSRAFSRVLCRGYAASAYRALSSVEYSSCTRPPAPGRPVVIVRHNTTSSSITLAWLADAGWI